MRANSGWRATECDARGFRGQKNSGMIEVSWPSGLEQMFGPSANTDDQYVIATVASSLECPKIIR
jgi:hypothetical protein